MANPKTDRPQKRVRGPNAATIIAAAATVGQQLVGTVIRPGGVVELRFAPAGEVPATVVDDPK